MGADELPLPELEKRSAAERAAAMVEPGMLVGLGTGTTVAYLLRALAARRVAMTCVATSPATESAARELGLDVRANRGIERLDLAIDGADQVTPEHWLVKGAGGALTREKVVAAAADRFVVVVSRDKLVTHLSPPVPVEVLEFGLEATLRRLGDCRVRAGWPQSPDGGVICDLYEPVTDPAELDLRLSGEAGVVGHGVFRPRLVHAVVIGGIDRAEVVPTP